jgi:hypothetical protein
MGEMGEEELKDRDILESGSCLETGVQVDADALGMDSRRAVVPREGFTETWGIVGAYPATEQEGHGAVVGLKQTPVEMTPTASHRRTLSVEEKVIDTIGVGLIGGHLLAATHADGLHHLDTFAQSAAQVTDESRRLVAVQLNDVETEGIDTGDDVLGRSIDKDTYPLGTLAIYILPFTDGLGRL